MNETKIEDKQQLQNKELLKRIELMEQKLDKHSKDMDNIVKILENKFMWELNLDGMEMLRGINR